MAIFGNYDAADQKPKWAVLGGVDDPRYIYASNQGWTIRRWKSVDGSKFYDEVLASVTLYTNSGLGTPVTRAINGTGGGYPSIGGAYAVDTLVPGTGYSAGTKATTGGSGTGATVAITIGFNIAVTVPGTGYTAGTKATTGGTGTGLTVAVTVSGGVIQTVTIVSPGTGYTTGNVVSIVGGTGGTATLTSFIATADLAAYGSGYADGETLTIAGGTGGTVRVRV